MNKIKRVKTPSVARKRKTFNKALLEIFDDLSIKH